MEENVSGFVCTTSTKELVVEGYSGCAVDTFSRETQTKSWENDTKKTL